MALNLVSNYSAQVAHRNLAATDMAASQSLAKLSSGTRVVSAKDDAASLAIGSRLSSEVQALKQASVNAGQASSMLQIADGAMAKVGDILTRMKTLAVQSSSGQISSTERGMLDTEYQALISEVDRISQVTKFNGTTLVAGSSSTTTALNGMNAAGNKIEAADGVSSIQFGNSVGDARMQMSFDATTKVMTVKNLTTGVSQGIDIGAAAISQNGSQTVNFSQLDTTVTLNAAFDKSTSILPTGTFTAGTAAGNVQAGTIELVSVGAAAQLQTSSAVTISGAAANASVLTLGTGADRFEATGVDLTSVGNKTVTLTGLGASAGSSITFKFTVDTAFDNAGVAAGDNVMNLDALGSVAYATAAASNSTAFTFKLGSGTTAGVDSLAINIDSISTAALGVNGGDITTQANADTALDAIASAIDTLNTARANVGSAQNRMQFAADNLATSIENQEASRSALLDLDVASEMTNFTSKQVLLQAGVAMLAQANQMPNQLMKLFG
jgi:flagellin